MNFTNQPITLAPRSEQDHSDLITIAITCYNLEKYIERAITSVTKQTYQNLEILIIDDGSTDNSPAICDTLAEMDDRIRVLHVPNGGPGLARNYAIQQAKGEYLAFLDGDDFVEQEMYACLYDAMVATGADVGLCKNFALSVDDTKMPPTSVWDSLDNIDVSCPTFSVQPMTRDELLTCLIQENEDYPIRNAVWNKLYRMDLIRDSAMPAQKYYEDILFTMKLMARVEKAAYVDLPLYDYITDRPESIMNQGVNEGILTDQIPAYRAKDEFLHSIGRDDLVTEHDYLVYKKLLLLYTEARRSKDPSKRAQMAELGQVINGCRERFDEIYSCSIADPHVKLRMQLFLRGPVFYNIFMDVNDKIILPLRGLK